MRYGQIRRASAFGIRLWGQHSGRVAGIRRLVTSPQLFVPEIRQNSRGEEPMPVVDLPNGDEASAQQEKTYYAEETPDSDANEDESDKTSSGSQLEEVDGGAAPNFKWLWNVLLFLSLLMNAGLLLREGSKQPPRRSLVGLGLTWDQISELFLFIPLGDLAQKNSEGRTPLMESVLFGELNIFILLVGLGASLTDYDLDGRSIFLLALKENKDDVCGWLLDEHYDTVINQQDNRGWCTIHHVAKSGKLDLLCKCCSGGRGSLQPTLKTKDGETPFLIAAAYGQLDIVKTLKNFADGKTNSQKNDALMLAAKYGHGDVVEYLLSELGFSINHYNHDYETPLMLAAKGGHVSVVRILIDQGANATMTTSNLWWGKTAMDYAINLPSGRDRDEIVRLLESYQTPGVAYAKRA